MTSKEYILYFIEPFTKKSILMASVISSGLFSIANWFGFVFIEEWIGISIQLFVIYSLLTVCDTLTGLLKSVVRKGEKFRSELFIKKFFSVALIMISLGVTTNLEMYTNIDILKPLFEFMRIFLYVGFIIWEFTSIRENADELKWDSIVALIDIILLPLEMIRDTIKDKI